MHQVDVAEQRVGIRIALTCGRRLLALGVRDGQVEPRQHAGDELAEQLARVALRDLHAVRLGRQRLGHRSDEALRQRQRVLRNAEVADQVQQPRAVALQAHQPRVPQRLACDLAGDEGVAVAVAADPGAEAEQRRQTQCFARELFCVRRLDLGVDLRHHVEQVLVEEIQAPLHFLLDGGLLELEFAGEPQQFDLVADRALQFVALARGPAWRFQVEQAQVNAAVTLEHGDALGLGRVRRDDRPDADAGQRLAHFTCGDARRRRAGEHLREGAHQLLVAAFALDRTAPAHVAVLLGDREQLEPQRLGLDRAGQQARRHRRRAGLCGLAAVAQRRSHLRVVALDHADQQLAQQLRAREAVGAGLLHGGLGGQGFSHRGSCWRVAGTLVGLG